MISHSLRKFLLAKKNIPQIHNVRNCYPSNAQYYTTMPRVYVRPRERILWLVTLVIIMSSFPTWVLYNIPYYRGEKRKRGVYMDEE